MPEQGILGPGPLDGQLVPGGPVQRIPQCLIGGRRSVIQGRHATRPIRAGPPERIPAAMLLTQWATLVVVGGRGTRTGMPDAGSEVRRGGNVITIPGTSFQVEQHRIRPVAGTLGTGRDRPPAGMPATITSLSRRCPH